MKILVVHVHELRKMFSDVSTVETFECGNQKKLIIIVSIMIV